MFTRRIKCCGVFLSFSWCYLYPYPPPCKLALPTLKFIDCSETILLCHCHIHNSPTSYYTQSSGSPDLSHNIYKLRYARCRLIQFPIYYLHRVSARGHSNSICSFSLAHRFFLLSMSTHIPTYNSFPEKCVSPFPINYLSFFFLSTFSLPSLSRLFLPSAPSLISSNPISLDFLPFLLFSITLSPSSALFPPRTLVYIL